MDVDELMKLKRPLTSEEMAFMEEKLLELTRELGSEIAKITKDLDPNDPDVAKLLAAPGKIRHNIESAIECRAEEAVHESRRDRRRRMRAAAKGEPEIVYGWEKLPVYAWINEFARVVGRLLATLPRRLHIQAHNLAGQATLISNCIALGHLDCPPGEVAPKEELRASRKIAYHATFTVMDILEELSRTTKSGRSDVAHGMELIGKIRTHFENALAELDADAPSERPALVH